MPKQNEGMNKTNAVLLLFLLLIFAAPVVGQEAGQSARGGVVPGVLGSVDPMSRIEGVITPDLQQLEMEDGTIIARDDLINPEYFDTTRPSFWGTLAVAPIAGVVAKFVVDQIEGPLACAALDTLLPGESGSTCAGEADGGLSYLEAMGLSTALAIPIWAIYPYFSGVWKPW